jgi:hypothetical protein
MNKRFCLFYALSLLLTQVACGQQLEGKTLSTTTDDHSRVVIIEQGKRKILELPASPQKWLRHFRLMHRSAKFVADEYATDKSSSLVKKIVAVDSTGQAQPLCEFNLNTKEEFHNFFVSHNDSVLLILSTQWNVGHGYTSILRTRDLKGVDKVYEKLQEGSYYAYESPWSPSGDRFVYVAQHGEAENVYVMDIVSKKSTLISKGDHASWSPVRDQLVFEYGRYVFGYDLDKKQVQKLYKHRRTEIVKHIHWSPKGDKILVGYYRLPFGIDMFSSYHEKLIDVNNRSVQSMEGNHMEHDEFSWK